MNENSPQAQLNRTTANRPLRVAHVLTGEQIWGVENYVFNLIQSLSADDFESEVVCAHEGSVPDKFRAASIKVTILPMAGYTDLKAMSALSQLIQSSKIDLLHTHLGVDSFLGTIAAKISGIKTVTSVHFDQPNYSGSAPIVRSAWASVQKIKNKMIDHFLPITENVGIELSKREAVPQSKITVVHPGIPDFTTGATRAQTRAALNIEADDVVLVGVGRLEEEKNFACLIDAISLMSATTEHLKVWIVGDGSQKDQLKEQVKTANLESVINILGYRSDARELLHAADIFVLPSKAEPFGMAAVEAMFGSLPVIGTRGPGLGTIVADQETGFLVEPDSADALSNRITQLVTNSELRERLGKAGRIRALGTFSSTAMAKKIGLIYKQLILR